MNSLKFVFDSCGFIRLLQLSTEFRLKRPIGLASLKRLLKNGTDSYEHLLRRMPHLL